MTEQWRFYSKCPTPRCGAFYAHHIPLRDLRLQLRTCDRCGASLESATAYESTLVALIEVRS
jgi:ribosomal protein S27AE